MKHAKYLVALGIILSCSPAVEARDFSPCSKIISDGLREYSVSSSSSERLEYVYDNYCRADSSKKDSSWKASVDVVVENLPVSLTGAGTDSQSQMSNFCKSYQATRADHSNVNTYSEKIVGKAYDTFTTCMRIANDDVNIYHTFNGYELANIYVAANVNTPVIIDGLSTSGPVACQARGASSPMGESTQITVSKTTNIVCRRSADKDQNAPNIYQEAAVTLSTNVGPYEFLMPAVPSDYAVKNITADLQKEFNLRSLAMQDRFNAIIPNEVTFYSEATSVPSGGTGVRTVSCPTGWTPKDGGLGPQPNYSPFVRVHTQAVPGGYVVDAWNQAGDQRGWQLMIAQAVCVRPPLSGTK